MDKKNAPILALLKIPYAVIRWDYWLNHPDADQLLVETKMLYENNPEFRSACEADIQDYIARLKNRGQLVLELGQARHFCLQYLLEECSIMCLWLETGCQYELYPNKRTEAMRFIYEKRMKTSNSLLLKPITIRFYKKEPIKAAA